MPLLGIQTRTIKHLQVSLQASRNFYQKGTRANRRMKLKHSATSREHLQDMLQLNYEALGGYCGGRHPGDPHGGPIRPLGQGMGQANYSRRDIHGLLAAQDIMKLLAE